MKKVGIIGGAGPLASALLYETIVQESYCRALAVPEIFLINYPFSRGLKMEEGKGNAKIIQDELSYCMNALVQNEVEIGILACNTLHLYMQRLPMSGIHFLSLPHSILKKAMENKHHRLLMLGTENACRSSLYSHPGFTMLYPPQKEQQLVDEVIDRVLEGQISQKDALSISNMIAHLSKEMTFDGVILGCTDLPVLHHHYPIRADKPLYDSIKIPAKILRGIL